MGHIKEPKGVDFIINSEPLTDEERSSISKFISEYKSKHANKKTRIKLSPGKALNTNISNTAGDN
ncbi:MAG: hypothetical protein ABIN25_05350 [Ginsengibacter sp.]